eukprot:Gregarina_sp_Poly_1__5990@NODE_3154_length_1333_cov_99_270932_g1923_i1_p2_GENE_NODE_3154_length_1333_cov_99_270932_g1923_i1NODE_3154_length_1333_cov_99_270932_g1923_i1_p2_ORF_typecomplete_len160_score21_57_NODE_3154_length_1333_cov_99_270932_g1923_i1294773
MRSFYGPRSRLILKVFDLVESIDDLTLARLETPNKDNLDEVSFNSEFQFIEGQLSMKSHHYFAAKHLSVVTNLSLRNANRFNRKYRISKVVRILQWLALRHPKYEYLSLLYLRTAAATKCLNIDELTDFTRRLEICNSGSRAIESFVEKQKIFLCDLKK